MDPKIADKPVMLQSDRPVTGAALMPVTRLISRPSVTIVNGQLVAVLELLRAAA